MVAPRVTTTLTPPGIGHDRDLATPANTYNSGTNTFGMRLSTSLFYLAAGVSAYLLARSVDLQKIDKRPHRVHHTHLKYRQFDNNNSDSTW
ncbi:unnamed protein product [Fusarium graminearum]|uniref:Uncharacterized protein n=1 Tax=Gibberella zeae TaxID=5518 RepID=A0A4E9DUB9_GIBZA|nr:unnamed protein product [Fusarium graminearum]CAF3646516.1 unnamed protein product [Fusarium graminearum]CAG1963377.1 unnamed protein product [Fusarium graminearum]CAG1973685.1 unnamed protein product [Fusarium graminearum]